MFSTRFVIRAGTKNFVMEKISPRERKFRDNFVDIPYGSVNHQQGIRGGDIIKMTKITIFYFEVIKY